MYFGVSVVAVFCARAFYHECLFPSMEIDDKEVARLTKKVLHSIFCEACCCFFTGVPLCLALAASVVRIEIAQGHYEDALWYAILPFVFIAALLSKLYLGFRGVKASNPEQLLWYSRMSYVSLIPMGWCGLYLYIIGFLGVVMLHGGDPPGNESGENRNMAIALTPAISMVLLMACQLLGAPAAASLSRHIDMQPPPCPPLAAGPVGKSGKPVRDDCSTEPSHTGAEFGGQCRDEEKEIV